jgi:hypothetical protein
MFRSTHGRVNIALLLLIAAVLAFGGWFVYDRWIKSDETKIRQLIEGAAQSARERRPSGVSSVLAKDFRGPGGATSDLIHAWLVRAMIAEYRFIEVELTPQPLVVVLTDPKSATVDARVRFRGKADEGASWDELPPHYGNAEGVPIHMNIVKTDEGWKVKSLEIVEPAKP